MVSISCCAHVQRVTSELPGRSGRIVRDHNVYVLGIWVSRYVISDYYYYYYCTLLFLMAFVWSRAICTVRFLMAELCRRRVPCVRAVGVPSRSKQGCTDVRVWLPKLGGLNIFCAHVFKRLPLGFSVFFFVFFSTLGIELTFSLYKNIYSRNLARFVRGVLIHATGLSRESIL